MPWGIYLNPTERRILRKKEKRMKNVLIYSGGLDSTTLLWELIGGAEYVKALSFDYGQRHERELHNAQHICREAGVPHQIVDLTEIRGLISSGSQTGVNQVPEGHYAEESMKTTIVPNRNMIMISIAVGHAVAIEAEKVWYAAHSGDHAIYPDCRRVFVDALRGAVQLGNAWAKIDVAAPYLSLTKAEIVQKALELGVPLKDTWSCYKGEIKACGKCGTCVERLEAFFLNGVEDPIEYEDRTWWKTAQVKA